MDYLQLQSSSYAEIDLTTKHVLSLISATVWSLILKFLSTVLRESRLLQTAERIDKREQVLLHLPISDIPTRVHSSRRQEAH